MKSTIILIAICSVLASCGSDDDYARSSAEKQVSARMKDPDSVKFRNEFIVHKEIDKDGFQDLTTCGIVDGKNSFGAYTGGSRFVVSQSRNEKYRTFDTISVMVEDKSERRATVSSRDTDKPETIFERVYWNPGCSDATHPPTYTAQQ